MINKMRKIVEKVIQQGLIDTDKSLKEIYGVQKIICKSSTK
jgi:hypothetical protein